MPEQTTAIFRELASFVTVGVVSTALYAAVAYGLVYGGLLGAIGANHVALIVAGLWSYFAQRRLTFGYEGGHRVPATRFAVQMAAIYLVSNAIYLLAGHFGIDMAFAVAAVVVIVPVSNFLVMKFWIFR